MAARLNSHLLVAGGDAFFICLKKVKGALSKHRKIYFGGEDLRDCDLNKKLALPFVLSLCQWALSLGHRPASPRVAQPGLSVSPAGGRDGC